MSKVAIVTDSTAYIPQNLVEEYNISVAPQILIWGEETFEDGIDIQPDEFYERLKTAKVMPTSSQVTVTSFHDIFTKLSGEGYDILAVLLSDQLSGTIDSATQARGSFPNTNIEIIDSESVAMALGFQVLAAARVASQGGDLLACKEIAVSVERQFRRIANPSGHHFQLGAIRVTAKDGARARAVKRFMYG